MVTEPAENTDQELWHNGDGTRVILTAAGGIGIDLGGRVITKSPGEWQAAADNSDSGFDFIRVFESWGEKEANLTAVLLDLAIAVTMLKCGAASVDGTGELTVSTEDLRDISEQYDIKRVENATGWTIQISRRNAETISEQA